MVKKGGLAGLVTNIPDSTHLHWLVEMLFPLLTLALQTLLLYIHYNKNEPLKIKLIM